MALNPADIAVVSQLLDEVLALPAEERETWLAALPAEHRRHLDTLRDMLAQEAELETNSGVVALPRLPSDISVAKKGDLVGPYRLNREIGHGGMGSVWLAERAEGPFQRQVALKLPRMTWTEGLGARMAREQRIAALLEHPSIARMYDAGVDDRGRPFIAMEYIDGQSIDKYCHDKGLDTKARLKLYVQVIRAVAYAHGRLVIHRDLKPDNVLIDARGNAHLLDFGIAKLLDDPTKENNLTQEQSRVLTPSYAAPEQIAGQPVSVATDVYSLGVMLYQLLVGHLPYLPKRSTAAAMEEAIMAGDAPLVSSRTGDMATARALRGDVDAILGKAMKRDPAHRYTTADALAEDIESHLGGDTVKARPDSAGYRLRKALWRYRIGVAAVVAVVVAVGFGGAVALIQARKAVREAERARQVTEFVTDLLRVNAMKRPPGGAVPTGGFLDQGVQLIQERFAEQPATQVHLFRAVAEIYADLGAEKLALRYAQRHVDALEALGAPNEQRVQGLFLLARALANEERLGQAEEAVRLSVKLARSDPELAFEAQARLALLQVRLGKTEQARAWADDRSAFTSVAGTGQAMLMYLRGLLLRADNRFDEAVPLLRAAIAAIVLAEGPASRLAADWRLELSFMFANRYRHQEAKAEFAAVVDGLEAGGSTGVLLLARFNINWAAVMTHRNGMTLDEAEAIFRRSREVLSAAQDPPVLPTMVARVDCIIGEVYLHHGRLVKGGTMLDSCGPLVEAATDAPSTHLWISIFRCDAAMLFGRHQSADRPCRDVLAWQALVGQSTKYPASAWHWRRVGFNLMMQGAYDEALSFLATAPVFDALEGDAAGRHYSAVLPTLRARILLERGNVQAALGALPDTSGLTPLELLLSGLGETSGEALCAANRLERGLAVLLKTTETMKTAWGTDSLWLAHAYGVTGLCAFKAGQRAEARRFAALARHALMLQPGVSDWFKKPLRELDRRMGMKPTV